MGTPISLTTLLLLLAVTATTTAQPPLLTLIYGGCSPIPYAPNSAFSSSLNSLLTTLTTSSSTSLYNHSTTPNNVVRGLYQCRGDLSPNPDCSSCVSTAVSKLTTTCPSSSGAVVQLQGCYLKYDAAPFLGAEDDSLVFKKCGPSVGIQSVAPDRDSVLAGLVDGSGEYRVVGARSVRGVAQCLGDLSADQCGECVGRAVQVIKDQCGSAAYGDVFLGKCYVRFSVSSYTTIGYGGKIKIGSVKTFAIIAGLLAATVILVLFFTFLCRAFGDQGNHSGGK